MVGALADEEGGVGDALGEEVEDDGGEACGQTRPKFVA